jgi:hypothetical protein
MGEPATSGILTPLYWSATMTWYMTEATTKQDLKEAVGMIRQDMATKADIRDLVQHFLKSQDVQDKHFNELVEKLTSVELKVEAIMEMLSTRKQLQSLVRELKAQGIRLDESKIF